MYDYKISWFTFGIPISSNDKTSNYHGNSPNFLIYTNSLIKVVDLTKMSHPQGIMAKFFSTGGKYYQKDNPRAHGEFKSENSLEEIANFIVQEAGYEFAEIEHKNKPIINLAPIRFSSSNFIKRAVRILTQDLFFVCPTKEEEWYDYHGNIIFRGSTIKYNERQGTTYDKNGNSVGEVSLENV